MRMRMLMVVLRVVLLDTKHRILGTCTVYQGSVNQAQVCVAEVFRDAVRQQATALVAVHNHPSGDPTPSAADVALTVEIVAAHQAQRHQQQQPVGEREGEQVDHRWPCASTTRLTRR